MSPITLWKAELFHLIKVISFPQIGRIWKSHVLCSIETWISDNFRQLTSSLALSEHDDLKLGGLSRSVYGVVRLLAGAKHCDTNYAHALTESINHLAAGLCIAVDINVPFLGPLRFLFTLCSKKVSSRNRAWPVICFILLYSFLYYFFGTWLTDSASGYQLQYTPQLLQYWFCRVLRF